MKPKELKELIDFIAGSGLNEVNIETNEFKVNIKRDADQHFVAGNMAPMQTVAPAQAAQPAPAPAPAQTTTANKPEVKEESTSNIGLVEIKSPMIGTFYRSANPESPAFVNVGDEIKVGQPVCIIEAMKLFNEIESDISGKIVKVLVDDATPVEYDQPMFLVEPA